MRTRKCFAVIGMMISGWAVAAPDPGIFEHQPAKTRKFHAIQYFAQKGRTVGFGGDALKWTGEGNCSQNERMEPIISVQGNGVTLRNAVIVKAPDGIHVSGKNVIIENVIFPEVCEDAITANGADNLIIRNCAFRGARDKAIQLNGGKNVLVENCFFENCAKPVRVKAGVTVTVRNNVSRGSVVFVFADGGGASATVENNDVEKSRLFVQAEKNAKIELGKNRTAGIETQTRTAMGGSITRR